MLLAAVFCLAASPEVELPASHLDRTILTLEACRADLPAMQPAAEAAAQRLANGGKLYIAGQPSMISELTGRAGGFMMVRPLGDNVVAESDVVLCFPEPGVALPNALKEAKGLVITFGAQPGENTFANHAAEMGLSPTLANAVPGWLFTGELIAALTRLGKMPVLYESIGMYDGNARIQQFKSGEIAWHEDITVPPVAHGVIGNRFVDIITGMLRRIMREESGELAKAGAWAHAAHESGKSLFMYSMGHLFPDEVGKTAIGEMFKSAVYNAGFRRSPMPEDAYGNGDVIIHIGYQHAADTLLDKARPAGAKVVYVALRADRDYLDDSGVIWIDPMWDWPDACVPLEGYDVPLLAASGIVNGAIAWEIFRLSK